MMLGDVDTATANLTTAVSATTNILTDDTFGLGVPNVVLLAGAAVLYMLVSSTGKKVSRYQSGRRKARSAKAKRAAAELRRKAKELESGF